MTSYWLINGIGLDCCVIEPYVNRKKLLDFIRSQLSEKDLKDIFPYIEDTSLDIEEIVSMSGYDDFADLLCQCDDTDSLTYGNDGEGGCYFYYPPSMPWHHTKTEPKSEEEVIQRIVSAVQKITDMTYDQVRSYIDTDLYIVGMG